VKGWLGTILALIVGLGIGFAVGGGAGGLVGSGVGALSGAHLGACKAAMVAADLNIVDQATADRIARETLAALRTAAPEIVETGATDLASCRTQAGMEMLAG
jgi:uncharacterized spore protein YtfJ